MLARNSKRIGIAIDASGIRFAALGKKKGRVLERAGFFAFPQGLIEQDAIVNEESLRLAIRQWAKDNRLHGARAVLAVPTSQIIVRKMSLPAVNDKELRQLIHLEVETVMHLPFEHPVYDYTVLSRDGENTKVLVYAAPRSWIEPLVGMLREARIRVVGTGMVATALQGANDPAGEETPTEQMYINLHGAAAEIAMFHEGSPVFVRAIEEDAAKESQNGLRIGELTAEIVRMLSFYQFGLQEGQSRIHKAVITGDGQQALTLQQSLTAALPEVEFHAAGPNAIALSHAEESFLVPAGLLVRNGKIRSLNLLPRSDREQRFAPLAASLLAVAWVACCALLLYSYIGERGIAGQMEERLLAETQRELSLQRQLNDLNSKEGQTAANPLEQAERLKQSQRDTVGYIRDLEFYLPTGSELQSLTYSSGGQIELTVRVQTMKNASRYLFDIRRIDWLEQGTLVSLKQELTGGVEGASGSTDLAAFSASYSITLKKLSSKKEGDSDDATP
ncbi:pilus assembly protein PilM [Paenibacillus pasadenensis]|uniref:pilus assembly protein PilM n=1 Tax=Paenibacillus pasadenensis TaxID=217090 RepID=UPI00203DA760|nr:pilus assembly protein PilM [Paenibacillus pasadenensis]MCM3750069.1 pilus assembly protein PilM [Paenibacillus pasadenensis]